MRTLIEIPRKYHGRLLAKCGTSDEEYKILTNGILMPSRKDDDTQLIVMFCEPEQAMLIVDFAMRVYPKAVPEIKQYSAESD
jgi:hypothetical protein